MEGTGFGTAYQEGYRAENPAGLKWTRQRKTVYGILLNSEEPLSADQIYWLAKQEAGGERYALSTVYRILAVFEEKGLTEKTSWPGEGTVLYSLARNGHTHYAVCLECHRRIPLQSCPFRHMRPEGTGDFTVTGHKLELYGYCKECREDQEKREKSRH
ncbi:MAG: transcriptional repressor [Roseburia sp.]|nr:transcriptional repressor [Roseburia sp.]MCM1096610.1 transcriptional repressor [Ruminococcus flavefaciens]